MRKPSQIERLYLDFDGFFASVEQYADQALRGRPVGVVPFDGTERTCMIACSREAKLAGVSNVMPIRDARKICPDLIIVPQKPDLYRRVHHMLLSEIRTITPIDTIKSIDELSCHVALHYRDHPEELAYRIKNRIKNMIGGEISCSIGIAANRQLAKIACKAGKRIGQTYGDGLAIWHPWQMPQPLLDIKLEAVPGIGRRMYQRLLQANITTTAALLATAPKQLRKIWHSVDGERLWYALHGYDVQAQPTKRSMFGHSRVLPPESRNFTDAIQISRLLATKAARRLRHEHYYCSAAALYLSTQYRSWHQHIDLPCVADDQAVLSALMALWQRAAHQLPQNTIIYKLSVSLFELSQANARQLDLINDNDLIRKRWETLAHISDHLNHHYAKTIISLGLWRPPAGGHAGGKISYTRIPKAQDFW